MVAVEHIPGLYPIGFIMDTCPLGLVLTPSALVTKHLPNGPTAGLCCIIYSPTSNKHGTLREIPLSLFGLAPKAPIIKGLFLILGITLILL